MGGLKISLTKQGNVRGLNARLKGRPVNERRRIMKSVLNDLVRRRSAINRQISRDSRAKIVVKNPNLVFEESGRVIKGNKKIIKTPMYVEGRLTGKLHVDAAINNLRKQIRK